MRIDDICITVFGREKFILLGKKWARRILKMFDINKETTRRELIMTDKLDMARDFADSALKFEYLHNLRKAMWEDVLEF